MKAIDKYKEVFGCINHLSDRVPWTDGVANLAEYRLWDTKAILGISKTAYWKRAVKWACSEELAGLTYEEKCTAISKKLNHLLKATDTAGRYSKTSSEIYTVREALRQLKFFSENYLNKEFDVFLNLASNAYMDFLYGRFVQLSKDGNWSTHGFGGVFGNSVNLPGMQIDNVAYNSVERVLIANELKLGGRKNPDQILKYCYLFDELGKRHFVDPETRFVLLFISDREETYDVDYELRSEIEYCQQKEKKHLISNEILSIARQLNLKKLSWKEFITINEEYLGKLGSAYEVERKLLQGFNQSLLGKAFMQD
jgi:hypothetical protein